MKTISTLIIALLAFGGNAQTFQWDTNDSVVVDLTPNSMVQYPTYQSVVNSGDTVTLAIEVIYSDIPNTWDGMLCIYGLCLGTIPNVGTQATMDPIHDGQQGMVRLTVNPYSDLQPAKLQVYVYDVNHPNDGDTATWILNPSSLSVSDLEMPTMSIGPNPAQDLISVKLSEEMQSLRIVDASGRVVRNISALNVLTTDVNVSDLPAGVYTVQAQTKNNVIESRFIK